MTFKEIAREIAEEEGLKEQVNIAQISEILRITLYILANEFLSDPFQTLQLLKRYVYRR